MYAAESATGSGLLEKTWGQVFDYQIAIRIDLTPTVIPTVRGDLWTDSESVDGR